MLKQKIAPSSIAHDILLIRLQVLEVDDTAALAISDMCSHAHKMGR